MSNYQTYQNQTLLDLAIQLTGDATNVFALAKANNLMVTEVVSAGSLLIVPELLNENKEVKKYYEINKLKPATGISKEREVLITKCEGIGCWAIGSDFKVS